MALTHEYGLMLICWSTWLVLFLSFINISYDVLLESYGMVLLDIMVHGFFMWMGYTLRHVD